ncbi:hypothetical protein, unlikely [Trypanosoma brucei brucei TREU927]|uniref:Uncharacterized protein n=1 Tax=Trypanosoma brucei brucei (strain 927/4 GUTat10.1) TaxID=185431 RepID=Q38EY0_TRYB2|nr:hypothetical protein, unlikely [Trypanosoma brucei brucei TREU927]EAN76640.1 hypothetical protein, unlikely [Trypanosoma brucei brucei TREU927]
MLVLVISHFTMKSEKGFSDGFLPILGHLILHHALPIFFCSFPLHPPFTPGSLLLPSPSLHAKAQTCNWCS